MGREKENPKLGDQVFSLQFLPSPFHARIRVAQQIIVAILIGVFLLDCAAKAQEDNAAARIGRGARQLPVVSHPAKGSHPFWDKENIALFAGVGAVRALDYLSTRYFRDRGVNEWLLSNHIVANKPLFAGIEVAGVATSIGVSYLLHRSGHHKLERWVSIVHIGAGIGSSTRNYTLRRMSLDNMVATR
jgi:hypothetical protein